MVPPRRREPPVSLLCRISSRLNPPEQHVKHAHDWTSFSYIYMCVLESDSIYNFSIDLEMSGMLFGSQIS